MKLKRLLCYVCSLEFDTLSGYKEHARGTEHKRKVAEAFQTVPRDGPVHFASFTLYFTPGQYPMIGLQLVSMCFSTERGRLPIYLCHACHEKCPSDVILAHLKSTEHYLSTFAYLNPERLYFGWFHPSAMVPGLKVKAEAEAEEQRRGTGVLRVIDMPEKVFEKIMKTPYFQTMKELTRSDELQAVYRVHQPERMTLQEYLRDPARTHPLLGLNYLVEFRCVDNNRLRGYLCLLCKKRIRATQTIAHAIGFDHLYWYLDRVHPKSLQTKSCYHYGGNYSSMILDLAKQAQEISTSGHVQEVYLDSEDFAEAETGSYANALDLLKVIRKEKNESDLLPHVTPAQRLFYSKGMTQSQPPVLEPAQDSENRTDPESTGQCDVVPSYGTHFKLRCQTVENLFQTVHVPSIVLYQYLSHQGREDPMIGLQQVTVCIDTEMVRPPCYLCHICQDKSTSTVIIAHLTSSDHYFCALAFMDPGKLHFGWIPSRNMLSILEVQAQAVEVEQGIGTIQVLDVPKPWFNRMLVTPYITTMKELCQDEELKERLRVKNWVKLEQYRVNPNRKYPLLGLNFLVQYRWTESSKLRGYLCLLCERCVREPLVIAHLIGFDHVFAYLDLAHPASLGSKSSYKHYNTHDAALILDLATQAEKMDSSGKVQELKVDPEIYDEVESLPFLNALTKLQEVSGDQIQSYIPLLVTPGPKLVIETQRPALSSVSKRVTQSLIAEHLASASEPKKLAQASEPKKLAQASEPKKLAQASESKKLAQASEPKKLALASEPKKLTQASEPKKLEQASEPKKLAQASEPKKLAQASELKKLAHASEPKKLALASEPKKLAQASEPKKLTQALHPELLASSSEPKHLAKSSEPQEASHYTQKLWDYLKSKERREPVIGLDAVIECTSDGLPPYYLCEACSEKMTQDFIIDHLTNPCHRYQYLKSQNLLSSSEEKTGLGTVAFKERAAALEEERGFGEAQVFELETTQYEEIVSSFFDVALNRLQTIQKQQSYLHPLVTSEPKLVKEEKAQSQAASPAPTQASESTAIPSKTTHAPLPDRNCTGKSLFIGQPDETPASKVLDQYLKSKRRKEPVIGLSSLVEFYDDHKPSFQECKTCSKVVHTSGIIGHLIGPTHRYKYIKSKHPLLLSGWIDNPCMTQNIKKLHAMAKCIERTEGWGQFRVLKSEPGPVGKKGPNSKSKVTAAKSQVARPVRVPESAEIQRDNPVQEPSAPLPPEVQRRGMSNLMARFQKKKWTNMPFIGLREVIECSARYQQIFYICKVCKTMTMRKSIVDHVTGLWHRVNYLNMQYRTCMTGVPKKNKQRIQHVRKLARFVQQKEGIGDVQVLELDAVQHKRLSLMSPDNALKHLQMILAERKDTEGVNRSPPSLHPEPTPKEPCLLNPFDVTVKQEAMESQEPSEEPVQDPQHTAPQQVVASKKSAQSPSPSEQPGQLKHVTVKLEPVESAVDLQYPECTSTHAAIQAFGMVPSSVAPQKHFQDPKPEEAELPKQICKEKATVAVKQEPVESAVVLQYPECTSTHAGTSIEDSVQIPSPPEKPLQTSNREELQQAIKSCGMVPSSVAPQKHFQDPKQEEAELPIKQTYKEKARGLPVQVPVVASQNSALSPSPCEQPALLSKDTELKPVAVKQKPVEIAAVPATVIEDAVQIPSHPEKPLQTSNHEELQQGQDGAPLCEKVYWVTAPHVPPQDPRRDAHKRVEIPVGESHFSKFMLSLVSYKPEPLVGLGAVVECRSFKQPTFYLCLTCAEKVSKNHICNHIMSGRHQYCYILSLYPDLALDWKDNPTDVAWLVQDHERIWDVQVMKLDLNLYNQVASVPFGVALDLLQVFRREQNQSYLRPLVTPGHRPIVNKWTLPRQERPGMPQQNPGRTESPRALTEEAIPHLDTALGPEQGQTVHTALGPERGQTVHTALGPEQGQTVHTALGPERGQTVHTALGPEQGQTVHTALGSEQGQTVHTALGPERGQTVHTVLGPEQGQTVHTVLGPEWGQTVHTAFRPEIQTVLGPEQGQTVHSVLGPEQDRNQKLWPPSAPQLARPVPLSRQAQASPSPPVIQNTSCSGPANPGRGPLGPPIAPVTPCPNELPRAPPSSAQQKRPADTAPLGQRLPLEPITGGLPPGRAGSKDTELGGRSPGYSACVSEKRDKGPGFPQELSPGLKRAETETQRVGGGAETANRGGAPEEPARGRQSVGRAEAAQAEAVLPRASPWEPLNLKATETDKVPVQKAWRAPMDLQSYMEDPHRTQPLVGLSMLLECGSEKQASFYLCMACRVVLTTQFIEHIIGSRHRNNYLLKRCPDLFGDWNTLQDSVKKSSYLLGVAKEVEHEDWGGVREIQKVSLESATYTEVKSMLFDEALNLVEIIYKKQNHSDLQTVVTPRPILIAVKKEEVESQECSEEPIQPSQITDTGTANLEKGQCQDTPQEHVHHPKHSGTEGGPGVKNQTNAVTVTRRECQWVKKPPLIGLQLVIKCASVDGWPPPFYLCQLCAAKLTGDQQSVNKHLTSSPHQYLYIRSHHPKRLDKERQEGKLTCGMTDLVQFVAKKLEDEEGSGRFQVINMTKETYEGLKQGNYEYCMKMLKGSDGVEEERQPCSKPGKGNTPQHTAPRSPGPGSDSSPDGPSTRRPPRVSNSHCRAKMRSQEVTCGSQQPKKLDPPRALATQRPTARTACPSLEGRSLSQSLTPSNPEPVLLQASELRARAPGPAHGPRDTLSRRASPSSAELPPAKTPSGRRPSRKAASSGANEGRVQGQQISTVAHQQGLTAVAAGNGRLRGEDTADEDPWNYENRQFATGLLQAKRRRWDGEPRDGAPVLHPTDSAPVRHLPAETPTPVAAQVYGAGSNIVISPLPTVPEQEFLWTCRGPVQGMQESACRQTMPGQGVQHMETPSWSQCPENDRPPEDGNSRIVLLSSSVGAPQTAHLTSAACPRSTSTGRVPQSVSILGKRLQQSSSTPCSATNNIATRGLSEFDSPPVKIPGLDYSGAQEVGSGAHTDC